MPWNFPVTEDRSGEIIANAVTNALNTRYQRGRQNKFDQLAISGQQQEQALSRASAARQGIHFDVPGQAAPSGDLTPKVSVPSASDVVPDFQSTIASALNGNPNPKTMPQASPNERADQGELQIPERTFFQGGYINNREGMIPMIVSAMMDARKKGMETSAEMAAKEPYADTAFQRTLRGDEFKSGLDIQKGRIQAQDRASALTGATLPGGAPISAQNANAVANNPGVAGSLFRPSANVPLSPDWFKAKQFESDLAQQRTLNLLAPKTADALTRKAGELNLTPLNKTEDTATQQLPRMVQALNYLQQHGTPSALAHVASQGNWTNYLASPEGQQLSQAAEQAAMAGALATEGPRGAQPTRVEFFRKTYVPRGGDSPDMVQRKLDGLRELAKSVKVSAGRGYERMDPGQRAQVEGFIGGQQGGASPFADLIPKKP